MVNKQNDSTNKLKDKIKSIQSFMNSEFEVQKTKMTATETSILKIQEYITELTRKCETNARYLLP